ncbi:Endothelin-converting enzyme like, partial [Pseudolycoriella hygida]
INSEAENSTEKNENDPLSELLFINAVELQNQTDALIFPNSVDIWQKYLKILFGEIKEVQLDTKKEKLLTSKPDVVYLQNIVEYIYKLPALEMELYIWWNVVEELILHTTSDIRKLHSEYARKITKLEGGVSRSEYCTGCVNKLLGMAVSYSIAESDFVIYTRPKVVNMLNNIREAFNNLVRQTTWMDEGTKCSTLEKSLAMESLIGFPDWILEKGKLDRFYSGIQCNETTHLRNMMNVVQWKMDRKLRMFKTKDEFQWATAPTNVNAFHTFQSNAITVPIAILQYPFYDLGLEALNYGAIGTILGHELTHGFDDMGKQWWTNKTIHEYVNRTSCFINQYNGYYLPEISEYINGELTLGENIADNGGLREAFHAYQLYKDSFGKEPKLPGFEEYTHEQLLFISFGNLWCETQTMSSIRWAQQDTHSPGRIRLLGVLSNSPEFSDTFQCKRGSGMYPLKRCRIW